MTAVVSFGQAAAGFAVQREPHTRVVWGPGGCCRRSHLIECICLCRGDGLVLVVGAESYKTNYFHYAMFSLGGWTALIILPDATCVDRPLRISAAGRRRLTAQPSGCGRPPLG